MSEAMLRRLTHFGHLILTGAGVVAVVVAFLGFLGIHLQASDYEVTQLRAQQVTAQLKQERRDTVQDSVMVAHLRWSAEVYTNIQQQLAVIQANQTTGLRNQRAQLILLCDLAPARTARLTDVGCPR